MKYKVTIRVKQDSNGVDEAKSLNHSKKMSISKHISFISNTVGKVPVVGNSNMALTRAENPLLFGRTFVILSSNGAYIRRIQPSFNFDLRILDRARGSPADSIPPTLQKEIEHRSGRTICSNNSSDRSNPSKSKLINQSLFKLNIDPTDFNISTKLFLFSGNVSKAEYLGNLSPLMTKFSV